MTRRSTWLIVLAVTIALPLSLVSLSSCTKASQTNQGDYYNAGAADFSVTGAQFDKYQLFRFDTSTSGHTLALPSAADIVANLSSPYAGEVLSFAVAADGTNLVTLIAGTNVTIKTGASAVLGNTTLTLYCELDSIASGSEAVSIY